MKTQIHQYFQQRRAGVLLHPTSLPSVPNQGTLGEDAYRFLDFLSESGFSIWQMLPINPTDIYGSPYQGISLHAGNPHLINPNQLIDKGWLNTDDIDNEMEKSIISRNLIATACENFTKNASHAEQNDYHSFKQENANWLDDYALYSAIKHEQKQKPWWQWPDELRNRKASAIKSLKKKFQEALETCCFEQYIFFSQWHDLRKQAHDKGILLFGDMPIFVAHDSVDVWVYPDYFKLDETGQPTVVAGVPPDYFSSTGQRWGNPLYNWAHISENNYKWWIDRLQTQLNLFDLVRIDHFRGLVSLWEIPAHSITAEQGSWHTVPGRELLTALQKHFGQLPLIAEDLGVISPEVVKLRDDFNLPGMKILLFAFDSDARNPYLPHNHQPFSVVYTGTHDNNTTLGWFYHLNDAQQERVLQYLQFPNEPMPWPLIYAALQSVCQIAILPMQDLLGLDGSHRMNTPGTMEGNWRWQFDWEWVSPDLPHKLSYLNQLYGRG